jgi:hypothetical protein
LVRICVTAAQLGDLLFMHFGGTAAEVVMDTKYHLPIDGRGFYEE